MPVISVGGATASQPIPAARRGTGSKRSAVARHNDRLAWALLLLLALAPLPLASNRPVFWTVSALMLSMVGCLYFLNIARSNSKLRVTLSDVALPAIAFAVLCLFMVFQMLPVASLFNLDIVASAGDTVISSQAISVGPGMTALMLLRMVTYGLFVFLMMQVGLNDGRRSFIYSAILGVIAIYALVGLFSLQAGDTILGLPKWAYIGSATGTFVNRNSFATFLAFGCCIVSMRFASLLAENLLRERGWHANNTIQLLAYIAVYALLIVTIVATQSRMGIFVAGVGTIIPLTFIMTMKGQLRTALLVALPILVAMVGAVFMLFGDRLIDRLGGVESSAETRFKLYDQVVQMIQMRPWTGFGGGTFDLAFPLVHQLPVNPDVVWDKAHNTYLTLWTELGLIVGSIPILMFLVLGIRLIVCLIRQQGSPSAQALAIAVLAVGGLHSLVDFSLEIQANTFVFLAIVALGWSSTKPSTRGSAPSQ